MRGWRLRGQDKGIRGKRRLGVDMRRRITVGAQSRRGGERGSGLIKCSTTIRDVGCNRLDRVS